jgi:hypothetical protein
LADNVQIDMTRVHSPPLHKPERPRDGQRYQNSAGAEGLDPRRTDELAFKVVRYEVLSRSVNLIIARGAYREAASMYPEDTMLLCQGTRVIERSK